MRYLFISLLLILSFFGDVQGFSAFKWIPLKWGETLPNNTVEIADRGYNTGIYVGRARYFDEILPAEIYADGTAYVPSCGKQYSVYEYEVLTISGDCKWKSLNYIDDIEETAVRVGTASDNEPIFFGRYYINGEYKLFSVYFKTKKVKDSSGNEVYLTNLGYREYLSCPTYTHWNLTLASNVTSNAVSGGKSGDGFDIYVARLKQNCDLVVGQVTPELGFAQAYLNSGDQIDGDYCQVLVGEQNEYKWMSASNGAIPDYAVATNYKYDGELSFIARFNNTISHLTHSEAQKLQQRMDYEILVMNQLE